MVIKKFLDNLFFWLSGLIGLFGLIFSLTDNWLSNYYGFKLERGFLIVIGLLSALLIAAGYERWKQREEIETKVQKLSKDFAKLQTAFLQISPFEIIEGSDNIALETIKETQNAESNIRVTTFKNKDNVDSPEDYYIALGTQLKLKKHKLIYECCFNEGHKFDERIKAFKKLEFTDVEYSRMAYYKFQNQTYFNFLIIDDNVVFIGFPRHGNDKHMQIVLKIKADNNKTAKTFIQGLNHWYDNILKKGKEPENTKELLK